MGWQDLLPRADENAFARQVQLGQQRNAFAAQERQQDAENTRAQGRYDMEQQQFQSQQQRQQNVDRQEAITQVSGIARQAAEIAQTQGIAASKEFTRQAMETYGPHFEALGTNVQQGLPQMLAMPDEQYLQGVQRAARMAPPEKPIEAAPGTTFLNPRTYQPIATTPGKVGYEDLGDRKVAVDSTTGMRRTDVPDLKKGLTPAQTAVNPETLLTPQGLEIAAQQYAMEGKLPSGLGRGAAAINAKIISRAAQIAAENGDDAKATVLNRNAYLATKKAQAGTLLEFSKGKNANTVRSLNVAVQHLDQLSQLGTALQNGDTPLLNKLGNSWAQQTGGAAPVTFNAMKKVVADELVKAVVGSGGGVADREEAAHSLDAAQSPQQMAEVIANYKGLMAGQLNGLRQQYQEGTGRDDFERFLLPTTRAELENHDAKPAPGAPAGNRAPPQAEAYLQQHPEFRDAFKAKYGYLPGG